jgi:hypothetical protein
MKLGEAKLNAESNEVICEHCGNPVSDITEITKRMIPIVESQMEDKEYDWDHIGLDAMNNNEVKYLSRRIKKYSIFLDRISKLFRNFRYRFYLLGVLNKNKILNPWDVISFVFKNTCKMEMDVNWRVFCKTKNLEIVCSQSILQK